MGLPSQAQGEECVYIYACVYKFVDLSHLGMLVAVQTIALAQPGLPWLATHVISVKEGFSQAL